MLIYIYICIKDRKSYLFQPYMEINQPFLTEDALFHCIVVLLGRQSKILHFCMYFASAIEP